MARLPKTKAPLELSEALADRLCEALAKGSDLRALLTQPGMPTPARLGRWLSEDEAFRTRYEKARELAGDLFGLEIVAIADEATPETASVARLRIDARKWVSARMAPKKWGDRKLYEHTGTDGGPIGLIETIIVDPASKPLKGGDALQSD